MNNVLIVSSRVMLFLVFRFDHPEVFRSPRGAVVGFVFIADAEQVSHGPDIHSIALEEGAGTVHGSPWRRKARGGVPGDDAVLPGLAGVAMESCAPLGAYRFGMRHAVTYEAAIGVVEVHIAGCGGLAVVDVHKLEVAPLAAVVDEVGPCQREASVVDGGR